MKRFAGIVLVSCVIAFSFLFTGCAGEVGSEGNAITVSATAAADVLPDKATLGVSVSAKGATIEEAEANANNQANRVADAFKAHGAPAEKVSIKHVSTTETYGEPALIEVASGYEDEWGNWIETVELVADEETLVVDGYETIMRVSAKGFDAAALVQVLHETADAGAIGYDHLSFTVSDKNAAYEQALAAAVEAAHAKAESLAQAGGVYVGRVVNLAEGETIDFEATVEDDASVLDPANPTTFDVSPAKIPVQASVTVSYAIS